MTYLLQLHVIEGVSNTSFYFNNKGTNDYKIENSMTEVKIRRLSIRNMLTNLQ